MALTHGDMLKLKRVNTPTVYNGWESYTKHSRTGETFNLEETRDFMPQMGPMIGRAVTVVVEPSNPAHSKDASNAWMEYRSYVASVPGPKIVIVQDLDKPQIIGSFWGEVNANSHKAIGCIGTITDGAVRDIDEVFNAGFKVLARRMCVGHAYSCPVRWNCEVEVFGTKIKPGQLIHADKHGFLAVPPEDEEHLLEMTRFMDDNEAETLIQAYRGCIGLTHKEMIHRFVKAGEQFRKNLADYKPNAKGEW